MDDLIIKLTSKVPVTENGNTREVESISIGKLKAKHLKLLPASLFVDEGEKVRPHELLPLIAGMANLPEESIDELDIQDVLSIAEKLVPYLEKCLGTGGR